MIGWDTDQFPTNLYLTTQVMLTVLKMRGFTTGGPNFDAKVRRERFEPIDLFYAHIGGMDAFARGLKSAAAIRADGRLADFSKKPLRLVGEWHGRVYRSGKRGPCLS
jgi:xylose isomerase